MNGGRGLFLAVMLVTSGLAGCLGGDDAGPGSQLERTAQADAETGGVEGVVTDNAVQPIGEANVTLVEIDRTTTTAQDGSYAFSQVSPGSYTLRVEAPGFIPTSEQVSVRAQEVAVTDFLLTHLQTEEAYTQQFELNGFFECGVEVGWNVSGAPEPADSQYLGLAACAVPNSVLGGNATNDRFSHTFELEAPLNTVVYEMTWEASSQFSQWMTTRMEVRGFANDGNGTLFRTQGPSPIQVRLEKPFFEELSATFTEACESGNDAYCGYSFFDSGWPLQTRVFPAWQCASESGGGCVVAQQSFTHFVTAFYNGPAPEGYSVVDGQA